MKRTPLKRSNSQLAKGKPLSSNSSLKRGGKLKARVKSPEEIEENKEAVERQWRLFEEHWQLKPHKCESCNAPIWGENKNLYHDHLLEKSTWPEFKYEIKNLYLCCWECHTKKGNGFPTDRHRKAIEEAQKRFL